MDHLQEDGARPKTPGGLNSESVGNEVQTTKLAKPSLETTAESSGGSDGV